MNNVELTLSVKQRIIVQDVFVLHNIQETHIGDVEDTNVWPIQIVQQPLHAAMKNVLILVIVLKMLTAVQQIIAAFVHAVKVIPEIHMAINVPSVSWHIHKIFENVGLALFSAFHLVIKTFSYSSSRYRL